MNSIMTFREFLIYNGIWFLIETSSFTNRKVLRSMKPVNRNRGDPYRLNDLMSRDRFLEITQNLCFKNRDPPYFRDLFWEARHMVSQWNQNTRQKFNTGRINFLDESMSIWKNKCTCPGFFVQGNPTPGAINIIPSDVA